ncbi:MAG TPA: enoyl-CoA hydratase/isomerase family protein [Thermoanaerobaculia bacterium]|nr:enoyl-CoA hydratase/isomerase family protein [Thermoanaerobaculia bacterium]
MPPILVERRGRTAILVLNRPPLNILDLEALAGLDEAAAALGGDPGLTLVFVRGAGARAFSAGVAIGDHRRDRVGAMLDGLHGAIRRLRELPAITIAAIDGHCLGGGMELACACDLAIATADASFGQPEVELGCFPPVAAALYPARLGAARTLELLLSGRTLDAAEAERLGLVQRLLPSGGLDAGIERLAEELLAKSAAVVRLIKRAVRSGAELPFAAALGATERLYREELCATADMEEGIAAFLAKRPPLWRHR